MKFTYMDTWLATASIHLCMAYCRAPWLSVFGDVPVSPNVYVSQDRFQCVQTSCSWPSTKSPASVRKWNVDASPSCNPLTASPCRSLSKQLSLDGEQISELIKWCHFVPT